MRALQSGILILTVSMAALGAGLAVAAGADVPSVVRHILLKEDMGIPGREAVMAAVELPPGAAEGRHTHPAEVFAFVLEGTPTLEIEGQPTTVLKPGDVFRMQSGVVHQAINHASTTVKMAVVFVAEKGKPLTTQAP